MAKKKKETVKEEETIDISQVVKILVGMITICVVIYFVTAIFITKEIKIGKEKEVEHETTIQYEKILVGEVLNRNESEYYVILYDFEDDTRGIIGSSIYNFSMNNKIYTVDMSESLNSNFVGDPNLMVTKISDLRVNDMTLLKVKYGQIVYTLTGYSNIVEYFNK
jgi:hypothetical protein